MPEVIKGFSDLLAEIEETYADDDEVRLLLILTAKAAFIMGQKGLK